MTHPLTGKIECRRDDRGRLRLPAEIVNRHTDGRGEVHFWLRQGLDGCIDLLPQEKWLQLSERVRALDDMIEAQRRFKRTFFTNSREVTPDGNSRIQLPVYLTDPAGIDRDVIILAIDDHYEIWDRDRYEASTVSLAEMNALAGDIFGSKPN